MAIKTIQDNPRVTDQIEFEISTFDSDGCFLAHPYQVRNATIYYIERSFVSSNFGEMKTRIDNEDIASELESAKEAACLAPTQSNLNEVTRLQNELDIQSKQETSFFNEAIPVAVIGDSDYPAWLNPDMVPIDEVSQVEEDNRLETIDKDKDGNSQYGRFKLEWEPVGQREGAYVICYTWFPNAAGDSITAHQMFHLKGNTATTTSIPTHFTKDEKYEVLMERYLPEMFKTLICENDLTRSVLKEFNGAISQGFTSIEDLANQTIDLVDANAVQESLLPFLGNLFNLKLKSGDPTLWRGQIKRAIPLFKKKGTMSGLQEALKLAGMKLNKVTGLWQVISPYTFQESFNVEDSETYFALEKAAVTPIDTSNIELYYRESGDDSDWVTVASPTDYVDIETSDGTSSMVWIGDQLSMNPISISDGDSIRIIYETVEVPGSEQAVEEYIRSLPLADQRDDRDQSYPSKNWNVRLIEEDDPLFDIIVPVRHPFVDPIIYGKVRTEFPYSENIYNMEEYNGSTRESTNPCDIDRDFLDPCKACLSSKINVDVEIEELSNDRVVEAQEVVEEFTPFHNLIHTINFSGGINEFIQTRNDNIEVLIQYAQNDLTIPGNAQMIFNRTMTSSEQIRRDALADGTAIVTSATGVGHNSNIVLFSQDVRLDKIGLNESSDIVEVLSPSANAGIYGLSDSTGHIAKVTSGVVAEPLNKSQFTFRLSQNLLGEMTGIDIYQDDEFIWKDESLNFSNVGVKSDWDVDNDSDYAGGPWKVEITSSGAGTYTIQKVLPNGDLVLNDPSKSLPVSDTGGGTYNLLDDSDEVVVVSTSGVLNVRRRGRVDMTNSSISFDNIRNLVSSGEYFALSSAGSPTGSQWKVNGFVSGDGSSSLSTNQFYIADYSDGDDLGSTALVMDRLIDNEVGHFDYKGISLVGSSNHETGLPVLNGANAVSEDDMIEIDEFKENYLVLIDSNYYSISEIDGSAITLSGLMQDWETLSSGGTIVTYDIWKFSKNGSDIPEREYPPVAAASFDSIDRRGNEVIEVNTDTSTPMMFRAETLNAAKSNEVIETTEQEEAITFQIEWTE